jgi:hypothetical protein
MGMYTRLVLNVAIDEKQTDVVDTLKAAVNGGCTLPGRLSWMFGSSSYYHDNIQHASFEHDDIAHTWKLSVTCDLKNYEDEIAQMLQLIAPAAATDECAGYYLYEEDISPTLFWFHKGQVVTLTPEIPPQLLAQLDNCDY